MQVNDRIIADIFPIPHIEELVQNAAGKKLFSALDCFAAYNNISVHPDSRKYTAVAVYSRFVTMAMAGVAPDKIGIYLYNILIFTDDPYDHLKVLEEVLHKYREVGLMPNIWVTSSQTRK